MIVYAGGSFAICYISVYRATDYAFSKNWMAKPILTIFDVLFPESDK